MMLVIVWMILVMVMMLMMVMMVIMITMMLVKIRMKVMMVMVMIVAVIDGAGILVSSKEEYLVRLHHDSVQSWAELFEIHILLVSLSSCFP